MHSERSVNTTDTQERSMAATLVTHDLKKSSWQRHADLLEFLKKNLGWA